MECYIKSLILKMASWGGVNYYLVQGWRHHSLCYSVLSIAWGPNTDHFPGCLHNPGDTLSKKMNGWTNTETILFTTSPVKIHSRLYLEIRPQGICPVRIQFGTGLTTFIHQIVRIYLTAALQMLLWPVSDWYGWRKPLEESFSSKSNYAEWCWVPLSWVYSGKG